MSYGYDHWAADDRSGTDTTDRTVDRSDVMSALLSVALGLFLLLAGFAAGVHVDRVMAVRAGVARWEAVGGDGEVEFRFVVPAAVAEAK